MHLQCDLRKVPLEIADIEKEGISSILKDLSQKSSCSGVAKGFHPSDPDAEKYIMGQGKCWSTKCLIVVNQGETVCPECLMVENAEKKKKTKKDQPLHHYAPLGSASKRQLIEEVKSIRMVSVR